MKRDFREIEFDLPRIAYVVELPGGTSRVVEAARATVGESGSLELSWAEGDAVRCLLIAPGQWLACAPAESDGLS